MIEDGGQKLQVADEIGSNAMEAEGLNPKTHRGNRFKLQLFNLWGQVFKKVAKYVK